MKEYFRQLKEDYIEIFWQTELFSQSVSFCIAIIIIISLIQSITAIYTYEGETSPELLANIKKEWAIQDFISLMFIGRFVFLFFRKQSYFWLSQIFWLIIYLTLYSQIHLATCTKDALPIFGGETPSYILVSYLLLSPMRQFLTLFLGVGKSFIK